MDKEFHYYITGIIASRAGFSKKDAQTIAYASQYVDDNDYIFEINKGQVGEYQNYISQTMNITKPKAKLMRIYPCFHFLPGLYDDLKARRRDGKMHLLNTTPDSPKSQVLMDAALESGSLHRIGIAIHTYADTWAHQNFVGYFDDFNAMKGVLEASIPNIGHADAMHNPDIPGLVWQDRRMMDGQDEIDNKARFLDAAEHIFKRLRKFLRPDEDEATTDSDCAAMIDDISQAIGPKFKGKDRNCKHRIQRYKELAGIRSYDDDAWFDEAVKVDVRGLPDDLDGGILDSLRLFKDKYYWKDGYEETDWYKFQQAVKEHQSIACELLANVFKQMAIEEF